MIAKISRGDDTAGLLRYLLGPGRANEHTNPHLIASWDGDPAALEPLVVDGRPRVRDLADLLDQPLDALHRRPSSTVWHCSLRNAPSDRRLSNQEWAQAARHVLDRVGLAPIGDGDGCRWIVARHAADHVHLLVTLARQDGAPARTPHDYRRTGRACQELEQRFDLTCTRDRDSTAVQRPTRAEVEKARRGGREESARETLRREVRLASMAALDPGAFLNELQRNGLLTTARYSTHDPQQVTGYAVAWPGDHAPGARPVWFSGSTLAPDLSLPRLQERWEGVHAELAQFQGDPDDVAREHWDWAPVLGALIRVTDAPSETDDVTRLVHAAAWTLTAVARLVEGHRGGPMTTAGSRLLDGLNRNATRSHSQTRQEQQLLATAHEILRMARGTRPGGPDVVHLQRVLLDLLRDVIRLSQPGSQPRYLVAADRIMDGAGEPGLAGRPRLPPGARRRTAQRLVARPPAINMHQLGIQEARAPRR